MNTNSDFKEFLEGYVDGLIWTATITTDEETMPLDDYAALSGEAMLGNLAQQMLDDAEFLAEATRFFTRHHFDLTRALEFSDNATASSLGHDLAMQHARTGTGFDDRDYGAPGERLAYAADFIEIQLNVWAEPDKNGDEWFRYEYTFLRTMDSD